MGWNKGTAYLIDQVAGDKDEFSLENRIFNFQCGLLVLIVMIIVLLNIVLSLGMAMVILSIFTLFIFALMYYLSRIHKKTDAVFWPYVVIMILIQCGAWFLNGGADSSNVITMLGMGVVFSIISRKDRRIPVVLLYIFSITVLYGLAYWHPEWVTPYSNRLVMFIDCYISFLYTFVGLFFGIAIVMNNYHSVIRIVEQEKEQLVILTQRDTLTGTYNRRYMEAALEVADENSRISNKGYCLIVIDIDYFKHINDAFGHMGGDQVLIDFVAQVGASIGPKDVLGRVGGEEFLIICAENMSQSAGEMAEKLRGVIESTSVEYDGKQIHYTASFGVSCSDEIHVDGPELWKMADKALYVAKNKGRNRVELFLYRS